MGRVPEMTSDRPFRISIIPSVAMKGGIFILAMNVPEQRPQNAPAPIAAITPIGSGRPRFVSTTPAMTAQKVMSVPTERSIPPVMMTSVAATARTPLTEVACRMAIMLDVCMKFGDAIEKPISRRIRLAKANSFWCAPVSMSLENTEGVEDGVAIVIEGLPRAA